MDPPVAPHPVPYPGAVPPYYDAAKTSVLDLICKGDYGALLRSLTPSPKLNGPRLQKKSLRQKRDEYAKRMDLWRCSALWWSRSIGGQCGDLHQWFRVRCVYSLLGALDD